MDDNPYSAGHAAPSQISKHVQQSSVKRLVATALSAIVMFLLGTALVPGVAFVFRRDIFYDFLCMLLGCGVLLGLLLAGYSARSTFQAYKRNNVSR